VIVPAGPVLLATIAWIAVPGAVVALLAAPTDGPTGSRRARRDPSATVPVEEAEPEGEAVDAGPAEDEAVEAGSVEEVPDEADVVDRTGGGGPDDEGSDDDPDRG
jgi:hypothetical protein